MGEVILEFSDDTSVKDFGKLGFETENKGASMCHTAVYNFKRLEEMGIPTIFKEQVADNAILAHYVRVMDPDKIDLSNIRTNRLFPVEVMTRDVITATSSAATRLREGTLHYAALGLSEMPTEYPVFLPMTFVDGSTKLRGSDEYLPWDQLKELACATTAEMNQIQKYILLTTQFGQKRGQEIGFIVFDHKDEYAYDDKGGLMLADVPLALDEITGALVGPYSDLDDFRNGTFKVFQAGKVHDDDAYVNGSKQLFRDHYDAIIPEWGIVVKKALDSGVPKDKLPRPPEMNEELIHLGSQIYQAHSNAWTGEKKFDVLPLEECVAAYKTFAQNTYELR